MEVTLNYFPERIELDDSNDRDLLALMSKSPIQPESFYLTGYETIAYKRTREFALETVLASVIPFEKDLLIVSNGTDHLRIKKLCAMHNVSCRIHKQPSTSAEWETFATLLEVDKSISHVLFSCNTESELDMMNLKRISSLINDLKAGLIVHCTRQPLDIQDISDMDIDYMVCNGAGSFITSVVLARRSRLVQTEGNARNYHLDLYKYWQSSLFGRKSRIEPMAV